MVVEEGVQDDGKFDFFLFGIICEFDGYVCEVQPVGFFVSIDSGYLKHVSVCYEVGSFCFSCPVVVVFDGHESFAYVYAVFFFEYACANVLVYHVGKAIGAGYDDYIVDTVKTVFAKEGFFHVVGVQSLDVGVVFDFENGEFDAVAG